MAVLASIATGNFTTAATWGVVNATAYNNTETTTTALTTSYQTSSTFTPGAITISHIGVKLSVRTGTTGTITVALDLAGVDVAGTVVTINTADLPVAATADLNGGWVFFKLPAPVLLLAATAYGVKARTSSASQVSLFSTATTNWARALITTTTGAPAATDDLIIAGEYTGAGTSNSFTVTMDNTAATDFGSASTSLVLPAIAVCSKGTLSYGVAASTAYTMRVSGNAIVYAGGTFNIGTVGAEIPRTSKAELFFDCVANVDFGLIVRNLGTFVSQGLSRTSGKDIYYCKLNTDEAVASVSLGVDTDTGWLDNDEIAIASTTRTNSQAENGALNGAAGASTLTVDGFAGAGGGLAFAHGGTNPVQAHIILLTRNILIRGVSATVQSFVDVRATATVDLDWTQFKWLGSNVANKTGIDVATTTGSFNMNFCSTQSFEVVGSRGVNISSASGSNISITNCVGYRNELLFIGNVGTSGTQTISNCISIRTLSGSSNAFSFLDLGSTYQNLVSASSGNIGVGLAETGAANVTNFSGMECYSGGGIGLVLTNANTRVQLSDVKLWRNTGAGMTLAGSVVEITNLVATGNGSTNIQTLTNSTGVATFYSPIIAGDTTFSTATGISVNGSSAVVRLCRIVSGQIGVVSGIYTAHTTSDISTGTQSSSNFLLENTILASSTEVATINTTTALSNLVTSQNHDQVAGAYKIWKAGGVLERSTTVAHTGTHSLRMTPSSASLKIESSGQDGGFKCAVTSGSTVTPTIYVYEDATYNGARARLIVKRNDSLGITSDTVLDTATAASDLAWEALTGTTAAVTADGTLEFVIDCDGTAGNLYVDSASVA